MAVMPPISKTNMADISKLISPGNLLVRKVTWSVLTTTSRTLILSHAFGANCMTRIAYIYSCFQELILSHYNFQRQHILLYCDLQSIFSLSLTFWLPAVNPTKMYTFCNLFLSSSGFLVRLPPALNTTTVISLNLERDKQPTWEKTLAF